MQHNTEILRYQEGTRSQHPAPETSISVAPHGVPADAGEKLVVLVDLAPKLPHRGREIRATAVNAYWNSSGSIVARLRRALADANRHLVHVNSTAAPGTKCSGSITCAVLSGDEVFFGQIGAPYAYVLHADGQFEIFPERNRLLIPLGGSIPPVIHIGYTQLRIDSILFLATTWAAETQAREHWLETLASKKDIAEIASHIDEVMGNSATSGSFMLLLATKDNPSEPSSEPRNGLNLFGLLKKSPAPMAVAGVSYTPPAKLAAMGSLANVEGALHSAPEAAPVTTSASSSAPELSAPLAEVLTVAPAADVTIPPQAVPQASVQPHDPRLEQRVAEEVTPEDAEDLPSEPAARRRFTLPEIKLPPLREWLARFSKKKNAEEYQERRTTAARARLRQAWRVLLPGKVETARAAHPRQVPHEQATVVAGISLGVVLLVLFITLSMVFQHGGVEHSELVLQRAEDARATAYNTQEREDWQKVLEEVNTYLSLKGPREEEALSFKSEAQQAIDALESAATLSAHPLLSLGTAPSPRRIVVAGAWVYVLNSATDEVISVPLNEDRQSTAIDAPIPVLKRGQTLSGRTVEHLVDLAWLEPSGSYPDGALFIYSEGGIVYIYEPHLGSQATTAQQLQGDMGTGMVTMMEIYGEKIYLIQRQDNQLLSYASVNGVYQTSRLYFSEQVAPELQNAMDIAIDERVYLLMGDGSLNVYYGGTEDPFEIKNLPDRDLYPTVLALERRGEEGLIYLGDSKRGRIVVLDKNGNFAHQFRLGDEEVLKQLEAMTVSTEPRVLYLITNNQIYAAPIPEFVSQ